MDSTLALILLMVPLLLFLAVPIVLFVITARNPLVRLRFQARQIESPVGTWVLIVCFILLAAASVALILFGVSLGLDVWFGIPICASFLAFAGHQAWVWFLPIPPPEEFTQAV